MKIMFNYGTGVISLPDSVVHGCLARASKTDLCVLITLAAAQKDDFSEENLASLLDVSVTEINNSLSFWRGAGVISLSEENSAKSSGKPKSAEKHPAASPGTGENKDQPNPKEKKLSKILDAEIVMPVYTSDQIVKFIENHVDTSELIDACQQTLGKIFNTSEISSLIGMRDYLNLGSDYILLLMAYCAKKDKKSLRYIEKMALSLHDSEITTYQALEEHLKTIDYLSENESKVRSIFGINKRALTKKEKECFARWLAEFKYDIPVIERAFEITVTSINEPSVPYTNAIIERWYSEKLKTAEDIDKYLEENKKEKGHEKSSFNIDDFYDDAIKRSYE